MVHYEMFYPVMTYGRLTPSSDISQFRCSDFPVEFDDGTFASICVYQKQAPGGAPDGRNGTIFYVDYIQFLRTLKKMLYPHRQDLKLNCQTQFLVNAKSELADNALVMGMVHAIELLRVYDQQHLLYQALDAHEVLYRERLPPYTVGNVHVPVVPGEGRLFIVYNNGLKVYLADRWLEEQAGVLIAFDPSFRLTASLASGVFQQQYSRALTNERTGLRGNQNPREAVFYDCQEHHMLQMRYKRGLSAFGEGAEFNYSMI